MRRAVRITGAGRDRHGLGAVSSGRKLAFASATMLLPVVLWVGALEAGLRVWRGAWLAAPAERSDVLDLHRSAYPVMYDRVLGYAPRPSSRVRD